MYIDALNFHDEFGFIRAEAQINWEDSNKSPFDLFVGTERHFQDVFWADSNAFLIGCILPAWRLGERRIKIDGILCPVLCQNIKAALSVLKLWFPELGSPPVIEASQGFQTLSPCKDKAVSLFSCGIDSLATLRFNKLHFAPEHPSSIQGIIVMNLDVDQPNSATVKMFNKTRGRLKSAAKIADSARVELIPALSNIWWLVDDGYFYSYKWHGAVLSFIAAFFSKGWSKAYIASSSSDTDYLHPWGSHPLLDTNYSSGHFQIEHHGAGISRFEKTALVADWKTALENIRVCQNDNKGEANCGTCEKCIRTMTSLVALGKLKDCPSFPFDEVNVQLVNSIEEYRMINDDYAAQWYQELVPELLKCGRNDLAGAIENVLDSYIVRKSKNF
jgi:hypothetical protein